ncbi:MAG: AtpZ/AtpI family protein [Planctomycetes bacterium]|nr:AtpZ/AtpI family protein [Planctomycetota bacterium]
MEAMRFLGVGLSFGIQMGLCVWFGWWLDERFGTEPWWLFAGGIVGLVVATMSLLRAVKRFEDRSRERRGT